MSDELDELFGAEGARPRPRTGLVVGLLVGGLLLAVLGMACTAAPGGLVVLAAWAVVEKESDRVESGFLPADVAGTVKWLRRATIAGLIVIVLLFVVQAVLLLSGFYDGLWTMFLEALVPGESLRELPPTAPVPAPMPTVPPS